MVALALTTLTISAQEDSKLTVKAGIGLSSVVGSDADTKTTFSYKVGLTYDWGVSDNFSVIPGIELVNKGFKQDYIDGSINMMYLQIPILAAYKFNVSDDMKLVLKAGPYLSYGIFGSDIEFYGEGKINVFDSDEGFNRFDAGLAAGVSLDFSQFTVGIEYSRGLTKLDSDLAQYNQAYGVVFGYKF